MKKILVAGSSNIDFVLRVTEMVRKGETILSKDFNKIPGGKGANQACAVGKLGGGCVFLSAVGRDGLGDVVMGSLKGANVDVSRVLYDDVTPTGMAVIEVNDEGENSIVLVQGANLLCTTEYFEKHADCLDEADILLTQCETPLADVYALLDRAKKAGKTTILNPAPAPDSIPDEVLCGLDFFTPNETELEKLSGMPTETIDEVIAAAQSMLAKGVKNVLVTIGARGALLCNADGAVVCPTFKTTPVDTTAAGDTFNAGLAVGLAEGKSLTDAITFANASASLSITRKGAQTSIPAREEVDAFLASQQA